MESSALSKTPCLCSSSIIAIVAASSASVGGLTEMGSVMPRYLGFWLEENMGAGDKRYFGCSAGAMTDLEWCSRYERVKSEFKPR